MAENNYVIDIIVKAQDRTNNAMRSAIKNLEEFSALVEKQERDVEKTGEAYDRTTKKIAQGQTTLRDRQKDLDVLNGKGVDALVKLEKASDNYVKTLGNVNATTAERVQSMGKMVEAENDLAKAIRKSEENTNGLEAAQARQVAAAKRSGAVLLAQQDEIAAAQDRSARQQIANDEQADRERIARKKELHRVLDEAEEHSAKLRKQNADDVVAQDKRIEAADKRVAEAKEAAQKELNRTLDQAETHSAALRKKNADDAVALYEKREKKKQELNRTLDEAEAHSAKLRKESADDLVDTLNRRRAASEKATKKEQDEVRSLKANYAEYEDAITRAAEARAKGQASKDESIKIQFEVEEGLAISEAESLKLQLERVLSKVEADVDLDAGGFFIKAATVAAIKKSIEGDVKFDIDADGGGAIAAAVATRAAVNALSKDTNSFGSQLKKSFADMTGSVAGFDNVIRGVASLLVFGFLGPLVLFAGAAGGALLALGSSAIFAGGALAGGLISGIAQAIPALGVLATVISRVSGVMNALKQQNLFNEQESYKGAAAAKSQAGANDALASAQDSAKSAAEGLGNAQDSARDAAEGLGNAQDSLRDAFDRVAQAQRNLSEARKEAKREIEDLILSERRANISADEAQRSLRETISSGDSGEIESERLDLDEANLNQSRTTADANVARNRGVEGIDGVVNARRQLADARKGVEDARKGIADAREGIEDARQGIARAQRQVASANRGIETAKTNAVQGGQAISASAGKLAYLISNMSEAERELLRAMTRLQKTFQGFAKTVSAPMIEAFTFAANRATALLKDNRIIRAATDLSQSMGNQFKRMFNAFTSGEGLKQIIFFTREAQRNMRPFTTIIINLGRAFMDIGRAAAPAFRELIDWIAKGTKGLREFTSSGRGQSEIGEFLREGVVHLKQWVRLMGSVGNLFLAIAGKGGGADSGLGLIQGMTKGINGFAEAIRTDGSSANKFFQDLFSLVDTLGEALRPVLKSIGREMASLFGAEAGSGGATLKSFGRILADVVVPAVFDFLRFTSKAVQIVAKLVSLPGVAEFVSTLIAAGAIGGLGKNLASFFAPLIVILRNINKLAPGLKTAIGGLRIAFLTLASGQGIGAAIKALKDFRTAAAVTAAAGAGGGAAATGVGTAVGTGVAGGLLSKVKKVMPMLKGLGWATLGVTIGSELWGALSFSSKEPLEQLAEEAKISWNEPMEFLSKEKTDKAKDLQESLEGIAKSGKKISDKEALRLYHAIDGLTEVTDEGREELKKMVDAANFSKAEKEVKKLDRALKNSFKASEYARNINTAFVNAGKVTESGIEKMISDARKLPVGYRKQGLLSALKLAEGLEANGQLPKGSADAIRKAVNGEFDLIKDKAKERGRKAGNALAVGITQAYLAVTDAAKGLASLLPKPFRNLGKDIGGSIVGQIAQAFRGGGPGGILGAAGFLGDKIFEELSRPRRNRRGPNRQATGGPAGFSEAGYGGGDIIPTLLEPGEHVWTKEEVSSAGGHKIMYALRALFGGGTQAAGMEMAEGGAPKKKRSGGGSASVDIDVATVTPEDIGISEALKIEAKRMQKPLDVIIDSFREMRNVIGKTMNNIEKRVADTFKTMFVVTKRQSERISGSIGRSMGSVQRTVYTGMSYVANATNESLKAFDADPIKISLEKPKEGGNAKGGFVGMAGGGMVGMMGERGRDAVHTVLGRGEAVLNFAHQKVVEPALQQVYGFGLGDMFKRVRGYHAGGAGPGYARGGFTGPMGTGAGFTPLTNFAKKKFGIDITDGIRAAGTTTSSGGISDHTTGIAGDFSNGFLTPQEDAFSNFWKTKAPQAVKQLIWRNVDQLQGFGVPDHEDHVHLAVQPNLAFDASMMARLISRASRGLSISDLMSGAGGIDVDHIERLKVNGKGVMPKFIQKIFDKVRKAANKYIDKKAAKEGVGGLNSPDLGPGGAGEAIFDFFVKAGFTQNQAAAFVGNFVQESGLNPAIVQPGGEGHGLAQWGGGRFAALEAFAGDRGKPWQDLETQLKFVLFELNGSENAALGAIKGAKTLSEAVAAIVYEYERAGIIGDRMSPASAALRQYGSHAQGGFAGSFAVGGQIPGPAGQAMNAIVHGGEWVLNQSQQSKVARLLGTSVDKLKGMMGFSGGPTSFAGGGDPEEAGAPKVGSFELFRSTRMREESRHAEKMEQLAKVRERLEDRLAKAKKREDESAIRNLKTRLENLDELDKKEDKKHKKSLSKTEELDKKFNLLFEEASPRKQQTIASRQGLYLGLPINPDAAGGDVEGAGREVNVALRAIKNIRARKLPEAIDRFLHNTTELTREGGLLDQLTASIEGAAQKFETKNALLRAGFRRGRGGRLRRTQRGPLEDDNAADQVFGINRDLDALKDNQGDLRGFRNKNVRSLRATNRRIKEIRKGGVDDDEQKQFEGLINARRNFEQRIRDNDIALAESYRSTYEKRQERFEAQTKLLLNKSTRNLAQLDFEKSMAELMGESPQVIARFTQRMINNSQEQVRILRERASKTKNKSLAADLTEQANQIELSIVELTTQKARDAVTAVQDSSKSSQGWLKVMQALGQGLSEAGIGLMRTNLDTIRRTQAEIVRQIQGSNNPALIKELQEQWLELEATAIEAAVDIVRSQIEAVEKSAAQRDLESGFGNRLADLREGSGDSVGASQDREQILKNQGGSLATQISQLESLRGAAAQAGNADLIQELNNSIRELQIQVEENALAVRNSTSVTRQAMIDEIRNRAANRGGIVSSLGSLLQQIANTSNTNTTAAQQALLRDQDSTLKQESSGLRDKLLEYGIDLRGLSGEAFATAVAGSLDQFEALTANMTEAEKSVFQGLITAILENESALWSNTGALDELSGNNKGAQGFSSTAWQWYRNAILNGMGDVMPQYTLPQMHTGGGVTRGGMFELEAGEFVIDKGGKNVPDVPVSVTIHEAGQDVDVTHLANRIAFAQKTRR